MIHWIISMGMASTAMSAQDKAPLAEAPPASIEVPAPPEMAVPAEIGRFVPRQQLFRGERLRPNMDVEPTTTNHFWLHARDYPAAANEEKRGGETKLRLSVNEYGGVSECTVLSSSGHADLDEVACDRVSSRASFYPATDAEAKPTSSAYEHTVVWSPAPEPELDASVNSDDAMVERVEALVDPSPTRGGTKQSFPQPPYNGDFGWNFPGINDYPKGALERGSEGAVPVSITIGDDGSVTACEVTEPHDDAELNRASCERTKRLASVSPARDINGDPTVGRIAQSVIWTLPKKQTIVQARPNRSSSGLRRRAVRMPFLSNGKTGFTMEIKADGTLVACEAIREGELPKGMDFSRSVCADVLDRGVRLEPNEAQEAEIDTEGKGRKIRVEMTVESSAVDNADKPEMTVPDSDEKPELASD